MFLFRLAFFPAKIPFKVAKLLGFSRFSLFVIGIAIGLLVAPTTGVELRAKLRDLAQGQHLGTADPG